MTDLEKIEYLEKHGWKEIPTKDEGILWEAPFNSLGKLYYFFLDDAYTLETEGGGVYAYNGQKDFEDALRAQDVYVLEKEDLDYWAKI
jgi:hypothetical protein